MILLAIGFVLLAIGMFYFLKFFYLVIQAIFYKFIATEKQVDKAFLNKVLAEEEDYKSFEKNFDSNIDKILNQ